MSTAIQNLPPLQQQILRENFDYSSPFYRGRDLHAMLDCACAPELPLASPPLRGMPVPQDVPLSVPFNAKLREEFFGGILYDCDQHRHYMVDLAAYRMLRAATQGGRIGRELVADTARGGASEATLTALVSNGLLAPNASAKTIEHFPARDLSFDYLQSPIIVEVEVTYGCFRACRHCAYESSPEARMPNELTAEQWATVFRKLADAGVLIVQLTGGDPLFRDDSFDIVDAADDAGLSVYVRSDTVALNAANLSRIKGLRHLWHIGTSLDGADAATHDWIRGRGAFDVFKQRVSALAFEGVDVSVGATLHKNNYTTLRQMGQLSAELGAQWFDIGFLSPVGRGVNLEHLVLDSDEIARSLNSYLDGIRAGEYAPSHAHYLHRAQQDKPFEDLAELVDMLPYVTEWPFSRLRLNPTGSSYTAGKLKGSDYAGGYNALSNSIEHIWDNSPNLRQLRQIGAGRRVHSLDYRLLRSSHEFM
ncbi:radical SAM protein [Crossiella sp. SN42]|uniref:radical SAM protein n=1 Tax=Crossiella sp. SN42 TaxID=2944808 RepID=UPI00207D2F2B|nr:radical SAM protein [Crossiella sp. SN42]MCO1575587.1 radical SAM protein [Crossiella sp. SN42]